MLELHGKVRFLGAAVPEMDEVHRIIRRVHADEAHRERDVFRAGFALDEFKCFQRDLLGELDLRAAVGAQAQRELARVHRRENFRAEPLPEHPDRKSVV